MFYKQNDKRKQYNELKLKWKWKASWKHSFYNRF